MAEIEDLKIVGGSTYTVGNQDIIANEWEAGKTYVKGKSYVIREHKLYVCNVTHTSVEPFDATKWTEITIGDAIGNNIGDLSTLTTTDKSSLVGAVNEVVSDLTPKQFTTSSLISIQANETVTQTFTVTNAKHGIITGFAITSNLNVVALQFFFNDPTTVQVRVKNVSATADVFGITFFYI